MLITNNQNGRVKTKEQLRQEIQRYQSILSKSMVEYLEHCIELDFSVVRKNISDEERLALSELKIYRDTAIYNIYHRAIQLLEQSEIQSLIWNKTCESTIMVDVLAATIPYGDLFKFEFNLPTKVSNDYMNRQIGTISLYQSIEDEDVRKREISHILPRLEHLRNELDLYMGYSYSSVRDSENWKIDQARRINMCESKVKEKVLTEEDKKRIEYTNYICELFMKDYGLTEEDFIEYTPQHKLTEMEKVYVKNMPNLQIKREVSYL